MQEMVERAVIALVVGVAVGAAFYGLFYLAERDDPTWTTVGLAATVTYGLTARSRNRT